MQIWLLTSLTNFMSRGHDLLLNVLESNFLLVEERGKCRQDQTLVSRSFLRRECRNCAISMEGDSHTIMLKVYLIDELTMIQEVIILILCGNKSLHRSYTLSSYTLWLAAKAWGWNSSIASTVTISISGRGFEWRYHAINRDSVYIISIYHESLIHNCYKQCHYSS